MSQASAERRSSRNAGPVEQLELTGPKKVAALLLSMDKKVASRLLKHFDEDDIKLIATEPFSSADAASSLMRKIKQVGKDYAEHGGYDFNQAYTRILKKS